MTDPLPNPLSPQGGSASELILHFVDQRKLGQELEHRMIESGLSSASANQMGVLRGLVSAYSQNDVAETMQRYLLPNHPRQCGLATLRMFVTGCPPYWGGRGIPQRAITSSRSPSAPTRTIGAI
jgi:hypothetical protein